MSPSICQRWPQNSRAVIHWNSPQGSETLVVKIRAKHHHAGGESVSSKSPQRHDLKGPEEGAIDNIYIIHGNFQATPKRSLPEKGYTPERHGRAYNVLSNRPKFLDGQDRKREPLGNSLRSLRPRGWPESLSCVQRTTMEPTAKRLVRAALDLKDHRQVYICV